MVATDLVRHFEDRVTALDGKAMVVCMSRRICVALYNQIMALRPDWHSDDDAAGTIKIVMTGSAADPQGWQPHIGTKAPRDLLAKRTKDPKDALKLVIVRDMWLTGFDAPLMHTTYIDKPMKGHGLMQAVARVNRVFRDKPAASSSSPTTSKTLSASIPAPISARPESTKPKRSPCFLRSTRS